MTEETELGSLGNSAICADLGRIAQLLRQIPCELCEYDCHSANPPVVGCPVRERLEAAETLARVAKLLTPHNE